MKKVNNIRIAASGKTSYVEGSNEYLVKRGGSTHREHRGPAGRRKTRARNLLASLAATSVRTPVLFCSDQHGQLGTGYGRGHLLRLLD